MSSLNQQFLLSESTQRSISWRVRSGFYTSDEIIDLVVDQASTEQNTLRSKAKRIIRPFLAAEWSAQLERQQAWPPGDTISDKLTKAFECLERRHKIIARMNFTCCQTCGISEAFGEADEDDVTGYVFFHEQDTEYLVDGGVLSLRFGSFTKSKRKNERVGNIIVKSLRSAGLRASCGNDVGILVEFEEWRRRLCEDEEVEDVADDDFDSDFVSESDGDMEEVIDDDFDSDFVSGSGGDLELGPDA